MSTPNYGNDRPNSNPLALVQFIESVMAKHSLASPFDSQLFGNLKAAIIARL